MSLILDNFEKLQNKIKELEKEREQSIGILTDLQKQAKERYGCSSIKDLRLKLERLKKEEKVLLNKYLKMKKEFIKKWKHLLEDNDD